MSASVPRTMPKHLKATYLADQESLLEETRATGLFYFPGVVLWLLFWGVLSYLSAAEIYGWAGQVGAYSTLVSKLPVNDHYVLYALLFLELIGLVWLFVRYLRWVSTVYAVTTRRVIVQRGILGRDFDEIPVLQVRGVDVHQTVGQRLLGYGTVRVSAEGLGKVGNEDWVGIPKPFRFQKLIEGAATNLQPGGPVAWANPATGRR